ncbi:MAG: HPP family protein [Campylobacteraceae bacterium]|nr:HPP family protein [Campylobacteraceae bacterium]
MNYFYKFKGQGRSISDKINIKELLFSFIGALFAMLFLSYISDFNGNLLIMGSFGASCVLLFSFYQSPFSQPRNVIGGHFISTFIALGILDIFGNIWWAMSLALSLSIVFMLLTKTVHPPAGSNPIIVFLLSPTWDYLFFPTFFGSLILVLFAVFYINLHKNKTYPQYWY